MAGGIQERDAIRAGLASGSHLVMIDERVASVLIGP